MAHSACGCSAGCAGKTVLSVISIDNACYVVVVVLEDIFFNSHLLISICMLYLKLLGYGGLTLSLLLLLLLLLVVVVVKLYNRRLQC